MDFDSKNQNDESNRMCIEKTNIRNSGFDEVDKSKDRRYSWLHFQ